MRKIVNIAAFLFFIGLVLDAFNLPSIFLNFLLVGALPGTTTVVSPTLMLAILTTATIFIFAEILSHRADSARHIREQLLAITQETDLPAHS
jgi:hypothetical protein